MKFLKNRALESGTHLRVSGGGGGGGGYSLVWAIRGRAAGLRMGF